MAQHFARIAFTARVKAAQQRYGSREQNRRLEAHDTPDTLTPRERHFIAGRDSLYMATASETGWPYVQHRGGPPGFVKVLGEHTLALPDYRGNLQYVSIGNLTGDGRVSLILVDHAARRRLKILGHARIVDAEDAPPELLALFARDGGPGLIERVVMIEVVAFDWNCPQHIPLYYSAAQLEAARAPLTARIAALEAQLRAAGLEPGTHA